MEEFKQYYYRYDKQGKFVELILGDFRVKDKVTGYPTNEVKLPEGVSDKPPAIKKWEG